jgi:hypothetical protein
LAIIAERPPPLAKLQIVLEVPECGFDLDELDIEICLLVPFVRNSSAQLR